MSKRRVGMGLVLAVCAVVEAAEPAAVALPAKTPPASEAAKPIVTKTLDLRIGDVRKYMLPDEYREALGAPDADKNTVVVEGKRELLPVRYEQPVPGGIIAPFWALAHPLQSWRIFAPDLNRPEERPREPADKVPPPIFRWGP